MLEEENAELRDAISARDGTIGRQQAELQQAGGGQQGFGRALPCECAVVKCRETAGEPC